MRSLFYCSLFNLEILYLAKQMKHRKQLHLKSPITLIQQFNDE